VTTHLHLTLRIMHGTTPLLPYISMVSHLNSAQGQISIVPAVFQFHYHWTRAWKDWLIYQSNVKSVSITGFNLGVFLWLDLMWTFLVILKTLYPNIFYKWDFKTESINIKPRKGSFISSFCVSSSDYCVFQYCAFCDVCIQVWCWQW